MPHFNVPYKVNSKAFCIGARRGKQVTQGSSHGLCQLCLYKLQLSALISLSTHLGTRRVSTVCTVPSHAVNAVCFLFFIEPSTLCAHWITRMRREIAGAHAQHSESSVSP